MPAEKTGTFLVTHADGDAAVLRNVDDGQIHTLSSNPGVELHDALRATVAPDPPMNVTWSVTELDERWSIPVERGDESPTAHSTDIAAEQEVGEVERRERAGIGEFHVISVPPEETDAAVEDVLADEETRARAARLGVNRVEVRAAEGVVSVRYLP